MSSPGAFEELLAAAESHLGLVGQTGWATGPHLHYEFRIAGQARKPLSVAMPAALPVASQGLPAFRAHAAPLVARLDFAREQQPRPSRTESAHLAVARLAA